MTNFYSLNQWIQNESPSITRTVFNNFQLADDDYKILSLKSFIQLVNLLRETYRPDLGFDEFLSNTPLPDLLTLQTIAIKKNRTGLNGFFLNFLMPILVRYHCLKLKMDRHEAWEFYQQSFYGGQKWWQYNHGTFLGAMMLYFTDRDYNVFREKIDNGEIK